MIGGESDSGTGISIHAPVKGATAPIRRTARPRWYFNPRSREGSDVVTSQVAMAAIQFQSTLP